MEIDDRDEREEINKREGREEKMKEKKEKKEIPEHVFILFGATQSSQLVVVSLKSLLTFS